MSVAVIKRNWSFQKPPLGPVIDWSHPLSQGLVGCWLMNEEAGNVVNDIANRNNGTNVGAVWTPTQKGIGLKFNGTSSYVNIGKLGNVGTNLDNQYLIISCQIKSSITNAILAVCGSVNNIDSTNITVTLNADTIDESNNAGYIAVFRRDSAGTRRNGGVRTDTKITNGIIHHLLVQVSNNNLIIFVDGISQTISYEQQGNANNMTNFEYPMVIGARNLRGVIDRFINGNINNFFMWMRSTPLSPQEIQSLYVAPYQMIQPMRKVFYSIPEGVAYQYQGVELGAGEFGGMEIH